MARSAEARKLLRHFDSELAAASARRGDTLVFTPQERAVLDLIGAQIDRKCDLKRLYAEADEAKTLVKLSAELRLLESSVARLLRQVNVDMPAPSSIRTQKAQRAAHARWNRGTNAAG
jgi:GAF domain-containing protein